MISREIKQLISMRAVADRYGLDVNPAGFARCPFHNEKTASLKIYEDAGRGFFCFGCNKGGDVIKFVQLLFGISFPQALERFKRDFGVRDNNDPAADLKWKRDRRAADQVKKQKEKDLLCLAVKCCELRTASVEAVPFSDEHAAALHHLSYFNYLFDLCFYGY